MATEVNMVERMKKENPHVKVEFLTRSLCPTMYMVNEINLLDTLKKLPVDPYREMVISDSLRKNARLALERMLALA